MEAVMNAKSSRNPTTKFRPGPAAVVLLGLLTGAPALAQTAAGGSVQSVVGRWLYDANGDLIGSVYAVTDGGATTIIQYGSYLTPGRKLVAIPSAEVTIVGGRAVLRTLTADSLRGRPAVF